MSEAMNEEAERSFVRELDARNAESLSQLFHDAAVLDSPGGVKTGRSEIEAYYRSRFMRFEFSQHFLTRLEQRRDDKGTRYSRWNVLTLLTGHDVPAELTFGTYEFEVDSLGQIMRLTVRMGSTFDLGQPRSFGP
jgi:hypothetical protein